MDGRWAYLSARGWLWLLAALAAAGGLWLAGLRYAAQPSNTPVASGMSPVASSHAGSLLDRYGIRWELENGGQTLAVDSAQAARARQLLGGRAASAASAPAALDPASAALQNGLDRMLRGVLGPGRAYVTVNAIVNRNQSSSSSLAYARRGYALSSQTSSATGGGYRSSGSSVSWGRNATRTDTTYAAGALQQLHVALLIDSSVPTAAVSQLRASVASAAGLVHARGDTLSVASIRFPARRTTTSSATSIGALLIPTFAYGPFALLGLGFLGAAAAALRSREQEAL